MPCLERHPRARARLVEHHRERAIAQRLIELVALEALLDPARARDQVIELVAAEITDLEEVPGSGGHSRPAACGARATRGAAKETIVVKSRF
jgi:hypothetical protein